DGKGQRLEGLANPAKEFRPDEIKQLSAVLQSPGASRGFVFNHQDTKPQSFSKLLGVFVPWRLLWDMPIYEFACPKCRRIYSFLSKRVKPDRLPSCPKCGNKKLKKEVSRFAMMRGLKDAAPVSSGAEG